MSQNDNKSDHFQDAIRAVTRSIAHQGDLDVSFTPSTIPGQHNLSAGTTLRLPLPDHNLNASSVHVVRGSSDAQSFVRHYHSPALHTRDAPVGFEAQDLFAAMETMRCEALGAKTMPGAGKNIAAMLAKKCTLMGYHNKGDDSPPIPMADALHLAGYCALSGVKPLPKALRESLKHIPQTLKDMDWSTFAPHLDNQEMFSKNVRDQLRDWGLDTQSDLPDHADDDSLDSGEPEDTQDTAPEEQPEDEEGASGHQDDTPSEQEGGDDNSSMSAGVDLPPEDAQERESEGNSDFGNERTKRSQASSIHGLYKIYTSTFDEVIDAADLSDPLELTRLRAMLDKQLHGTRALVAKLANRLQRKIMAQQQRRWRFDLEEGKLDAARLARIIANPTLPLTFKQEIQSDERDTVVSILIDNSGSMRGRPIALAAMSADVIAQTLERCNIHVEVLGFTTRAWKGGHAREHWLENGRPKNPGRLNDIRHIIYKAADAPMRRSRKNLGLMLKEGLLKENIDGEALAWAYNRLARRNEARKILMVISDGAPVDDSTLSANQGNILEDDLRTVINWIETQSDVELSAIGIGHDVTRYYRRAMTLTDATGLAEGLIAQLGDLFTPQA